MSAVMEQRPLIMARATEGDANSFAILIEPLLNPAYRLAAVMLADRSAAEDAVQEASIKAWRKLRQLRGDVGSLRSWFLSIVVNECRMARRQRWWSITKLADPQPVGGSSAPSQETSRLLEDFESQVQLGLGLAKPGCYRAFMLTNPARLVIDVQVS